MQRTTLLILTSLLFISTVEAKSRRRVPQNPRPSRIVMLLGPKDANSCDIGYIMLEGRPHRFHLIVNGADIIEIGDLTYFRTVKDENDDYPAGNREVAQCFCNLNDCDGSPGKCLMSYSKCIQLSKRSDHLYDEWQVAKTKDFEARVRNTKPGKAMTYVFPIRKQLPHWQGLNGRRLAQYKPINGRRTLQVLDGQEILVLDLNGSPDFENLVRTLPKGLVRTAALDFSEVQFRIWIETKTWLVRKVAVMDRTGKPVGYIFFELGAEGVEFTRPSA